MIYFIQSGPTGPIKIGTTDNLKGRLALLQSGNPEPLYVRAVVEGGLAEETALHHVFAEGLMRGEWFRADTPGLAELMAKAELAEIEPDDEPRCERCESRLIPPVGRRRYCRACGGR